MRSSTENWPNLNVTSFSTNVSTPQPHASKTHSYKVFLTRLDITYFQDGEFKVCSEMLVCVDSLRLTNAMFFMCVVVGKKSQEPQSIYVGNEMHEI